MAASGTLWTWGGSTLLKFCMVTLIPSNVWMVSINLKVTFFLVTIWPQNCRFLCFAVSGLFFFSSTGSFPLAFLWHLISSEDVSVFSYIDNWLLGADTLLTHWFLTTLGLCVNLQKAASSLMQVILFIGAQMLFSRGHFILLSKHVWSCLWLAQQCTLLLRLLWLFSVSWASWFHGFCGATCSALNANSKELVSSGLRFSFLATVHSAVYSSWHYSVITMVVTLWHSSPDHRPQRLLTTLMPRCGVGEPTVRDGMSKTAGLPWCGCPTSTILSFWLSRECLPPFFHCCRIRWSRLS